jgi:hypothetical protein
MSVVLERGGVSVALPARWSGRMFAADTGEITLHAGSFQIAFNDGQFGDQSTGLLPAGGAFVALTEYRAGAGLEPGTGLFAATCLPIPLDPTSFSRRRLQHARAGQTGSQHFFTLEGRPLCLYTVLSAPPGAAAVAPGRHPRYAALDALLRSLQIAPRCGPRPAAA